MNSDSDKEFLWRKDGVLGSIDNAIRQYEKHPVLGRSSRMYAAGAIQAAFMSGVITLGEASDLRKRINW